MGKQVLRCGPLLGPPAQHSRNEVYKLGHSIFIVHFLSHTDQIYFSDELGEIESSCQMSYYLLSRKDTATLRAYHWCQNTEMFDVLGQEDQVEEALGGK